MQQYEINKREIHFLSIMVIRMRPCIISYDNSKSFIIFNDNIIRHGQMVRKRMVVLFFKIYCLLHDGVISAHYYYFIIIIIIIIVLYYYYYYYYYIISSHDSSIFNCWCALKDTTTPDMYSKLPIKSGGHIHVANPGWSTQVAPFSQGSTAHSSTSVWQDGPVKPIVHTHLYPGAWLTQVPTFLHGLSRHSSTSVSQFLPAIFRNMNSM